jgi:alkanesulfonate monooxygenase SsuD/methylene tetrahydromethanopterin reductase-like flavin-dependent oxidoreductase (luciferase family)
MTFGGLRQVAERYAEACAVGGHRPCGLKCSYFIHFADNPAEEEKARARQIRYYKECVIPAFPSDPEKIPASYRYFLEIVDRLHKVRPQDLTENSVLIGSSEAIAETLQSVEAAGFDEVILYFNVGLKPHAQVMEEMARFAAEVAPLFG